MRGEIENTVVLSPFLYCTLGLQSSAVGFGGIAKSLIFLSKHCDDKMSIKL